MSSLAGFNDAHKLLHPCFSDRLLVANGIPNGQILFFLQYKTQAHCLLATKKQGT